MAEGYQVELDALRAGIRALEPLIENAEKVGQSLADAAEADPRKMSGGGGLMTGVPGALLVTAMKLQIAVDDVSHKHDGLTKSLHQFQEALRAALRKYGDQEDRVQAAMGSIGGEEHHG